MSVIERGQHLRVRVPATSANLGPGFDTLGIALNLSDEVEVRTCEPGVLDIRVEGVGANEVPLDETHLVVRAMDETLERLGYEREGLRICAHNQIPHGRGMGSSGAAIVAGVLLAATLTGDEENCTPARLLELATALEGHPDNVAPCLLGGLTIAWTTNGAPRAKRLHVHRSVSPLVLVPAVTMSTSLARTLQPEQVPHEDAIFNVSRSSLLVAALTQSPELLMDATEDRLHQNYRASAMPESSALIEALRDAGLPAVVSGAGPSVLVLTPSAAERVRAMRVATEHVDAEWTAHPLAIDVVGATVWSVS